VDVHNSIKYGTHNLGGIALIAGVSREASGIERLGETLTPVLDVWTQPEWALPRQELPGAVNVVAAAVVGEFSACALINPAASGLLVVCEALTFAAVGASMTCFLEIVTEPAARATLATTEVPLVCRDRRQSRGLRSSIITGSDPASIGTVLDEQTSTAALVFAAFAVLPVILPPGQAVLVRGGTVNSALVTNWKVRERPAVQGELLFPFA
jgi:hypothetical protein